MHLSIVPIKQNYLLWHKHAILDHIQKLFFQTLVFHFCVFQKLAFKSKIEQLERVFLKHLLAVPIECLPPVAQAYNF